MSKVYAQVYEIVSRIPPGKVLTYGLISNLLSGRLSAQGVGWAMQALGRQRGAGASNAEGVPWHRVVNSRGQLSTHKNATIPPGLQQHLLEREGVEFDSEERLDLCRYLWHEGLTGTKRAD